MPATMHRPGGGSAPETDPIYVAGGASDAELASAVATVNAAIAAKQDSSTAATDAELSAAVATLNGLLAAKQDAGTAATDQEVADAIAAHAAGDASDAELASAVATLTASIATKQDAATAATDAELASEQARAQAAEALAQPAATAATDAELAAAIAALFAQAPTYRAAPAFNTGSQNTSGKVQLVEINGGVVADPGENGHIYFELSPDNVDWTTHARQGRYIGHRNTLGQLGQSGAGACIGGFVPPGWYYRWRTYTAASYNTPDFIFDTGFETVRTIG